MDNDQAAGFWSYTRKDDDQVGGRITRLAKAISDEYSLLTGSDLTLFLDRESIEWGDQWRTRIEQALQATTFFIPVVTPRFFTSQECRNELLRFAGHAKSLHVEELVLPILYVEVEGLLEDAADEAVALIARTHYADWRSLRLVDETSETFRMEINRLAKRLVDINKSVSQRPQALPIELLTSGEGAVGSDGDTAADDDEGTMDLILRMEEGMPRLIHILNEYPQHMEEISAAMSEATGRVKAGDAEGKGFGHRILVARELAAELEGPAGRLEQLGQEYASELVRVDSGVLTFLRVIAEQVRSGEVSDNDRESVCHFLSSIEATVTQTREAVATGEGFVEVLASNAKLSKDLRPAVNRIQAGVRGYLDGRSIIEEWGEQADSLKRELGCIPNDEAT